MAISSIGSNSSYYNDQNTLSQIRLQQALSKNTRYMERVRGSTTSDVTTGSLAKDSITFLRSYTSTMSDVMSSANALRSANQKSVMNDLAVSSSDATVASATKKYTLQTEQAVRLDVAQIALSQENTSLAVKGGEQATQDMNFTVIAKSGNVSVEVSRTKEDGIARTHRDMLQEAAKQINEGNMGVSATVMEKDGNVLLSLSSNRTGTQNAFQISGNLGVATGVDEVAQAAQNAKYSVTTNGTTKDYTSQSNSITLNQGKIGVALKAEGKTDIVTAPDSEKVASAVSDLINSYNNALKYLEANKSHGTGVNTQVNSLERNLLSNEAMNTLGLSKNKDGSLSLDKEKLKQSLSTDPKLTKDLIEGSFGLAQTAFNRASSAMQANSASLVNYDLQQMEQETISDPINFMNIYAKNGAYNMTNYTALGLMMNYLV